MIKRDNVKPMRRAPDAEACGGPVWVAVGRRLRQRRLELGVSTDRVAQWTGVSVEAYEGYERGAPVPASLLAHAADLLDTSVVWFFQGIADEGPAEASRDSSPQPAAYRVATMEHRIQALAESFRKLDFEGQQHLLAISRALCQSNTSAPANEP
jgi:transcriptional regulator with XRE-family HTH domain